MKFLVISDTHGAMAALWEVLTTSGGRLLTA